MEPEVFISVPSDANSSVGGYEQAFATAKIDSGAVSEIIIDANYSGKGYDQNTTIEIEGGYSFCKVCRRW